MVRERTTKFDGGARPKTAPEGFPMYAIQFKSIEDGNWHHSRFFETVRAARNWARWLARQSWAIEVKVARGNHGGEPVSF